MGFGISGRTLMLEFVSRTGSVTKSFGTVSIPSKTASEISLVGGQGVKLDWSQVNGTTATTLGSDPLPTVPALKGAVG